MTTSAGDIVVTRTESGAVLTLRSPARRNAISLAMWRSIVAFATDAAAQADIRYVMVCGDGDAFSAGADINDFRAARNDAASSRDYDDMVESTCRLIEAIDKPSLAVIVGPCMGAGLSLAASCDLRIAAETAFFAMPAARIGLGYDPRGIKRLLRVFGTDFTRELIFTGERLPARRAWQLGAVSSLFHPDAQHAAAKEWAARIASNAPLTIKAAKVAIRAHLTNDAELLPEAERLYAAADASIDYAEGDSGPLPKSGHPVLPVNNPT